MAMSAIRRESKRVVPLISPTTIYGAAARFSLVSEELAPIGAHSISTQIGSFTRFSSLKPISGLFRQLEQEVETVIGVLQPGPLGIIEHKFSAEEVRKAKMVVDKAVENWRKNAVLEKRSPIIKDYIDI